MVLHPDFGLGVAAGHEVFQGQTLTVIATVELSSGAVLDLALDADLVQVPVAGPVATVVPHREDA